MVSMLSWNQLTALFVRACLALHFVMVVWRVTVAWEDMYWLLMVAIFPFLLEALYTIFKKDGVEWKQFSVCFFFYLCATLPGIWLLEIQKTQLYQSGNFSKVEHVVISGVDIPVRLSPDTWVLVVEEMMLYFMIIGRWILPRGDVGREQLTQLLFGFVGIASDIMELFSLFDEDENIRTNTILVYIILSFWSLSVFQFTLTFVTAHRPRRARGLRMSPSARTNGLEPADEAGIPDLYLEPSEAETRRHKVSVLRIELLATVLSLFMQDGPFLVVRLFTMIRYNLLTYSLLFFTAKNVLVILLLAYKIFLLLSKICCPSRSSSKNLYDVTHHPNLDTTIIVTQSQGRGGFSGSTTDLDSSGDLRKRRDEKRVYIGRSADLEDSDLKRHDKKGGHGRDVSELDVGDLKMAIEGPATPAKPMVKTKKYKKIQNQLEVAGTGLFEDDAKKKGIVEKEGIDNPALEEEDTGGLSPSGRNAFLGGNENPGGKKSSGSSGPDRKESLGQHEDPDRNDSQVWTGDPGRKITDETEVPVEIRPRGELELTHKPERHVSITKVQSLSC